MRGQCAGVHPRWLLVSHEGCRLFTVWSDAGLCSGSGGRGSVRGAFLGTLYLCSYLGLPVVGADTPFSLRDGFFPDRGLHVSSL